MLSFTPTGRAPLSDLRLTEKLVNGTFAADLSGWTDVSLGAGAVASWDAGNGGRISLPRIDGTNLARYGQSFATKIGQQYPIDITVSGLPINLRIGITSGAASLLNNTVAAGTFNYIFTATTLITFVSLSTVNNAATGYVDYISIRGA